MYISPIRQNDNKPHFRGLTNVMKKQIFVDGKKDVLNVLSKIPNKKTIVGELPPAIFEKLSPKNRPEAIKEICTTFEDCANIMRDFRPSINGPSDEYNNRRPKLVVDKMRDVFVKHNVLKEPEKFNLTYIGAGEYKRAWNMDGIKDDKTGEEICFKIFHLVDKTPEWHKYKCHGNYAEINIATYWKKNVGMNTDRNKFYMGDINNGYLMDRFVDENTVKPKKFIDVYDWGIKVTDEVKVDTGHNKICGISIDEGGSRVVNIVKNQSSVARYVLKTLKRTPDEYRYNQWFKILNTRKDLDPVQKKAGLALSLKHMDAKAQKKCVEHCFDFNIPLVDQAISYALKYIPEDMSVVYFEKLMARKHPRTQVVLMNEIPLLSIPRNKKVFDDINTPRESVNPETIEKYYKIAQKYVLPEVEEHLASYIHLLPKDKMIPEAENLISKNNYNINDRLLHKIKFVSTDEYSFSDKMDVIGKIQKSSKDEFIQKKANEIKTRVIRDSLED